MIVDFHTHIFPPYVKEERDNFFDDPAFRLLYSSEKATIITAEDLISSMDEYQIDKAVTFGFPWAKQDYYKRHNDYVIESVNKYPNRLVGFCCLSPLSNNVEDEVIRCLDNGLSGVGEIAFYDSDITQQVVDSISCIMRICKQYDVPVLLHTNEPVGHVYPGKSPMSLSRLYMFLKRFSENRIILAHWGGGLFFYNLMKKEVREVLENVWFDTAASPYLYKKDIYPIALYIVGTERVLFGSDYPLIPPSRYFREMEESGISYDQMIKITGENAARVLK